MSGPLPFSCECGAIRGDVLPGHDTHILCHCADCRSAYTLHDRPDPGVVDILQTAQGRVRITEGADRLAALKLSPKGGGIRVYASCCGVPLAYVIPKPRLALVGMNADRFADPDALGPVEAEAFVPKRGGGQTHKGMIPLLRGVATRILSENLSGNWRHSPFFDAAGAPDPAPRIVSRSERAEARRKLRA